MLSRDEIQKKIDVFKVKHGVQDQDEHIVATLHVMNTHRLDLAAAQDQTSHGANDYGIDGWHFTPKDGTLYIYQSKLSPSKPTVLKGFEGLLGAAEWLAEVLTTGKVDGKLSNPAIYNLARCLGANGSNTTKVRFFLVSPFDSNELEDSSEFEQCQRAMTKSHLNTLMSTRDGSLGLCPQTFSLDELIPSSLSSYEVSGFGDGEVVLNSRTKLQIVFLYLFGLVELFRKRGNRIFEKNVRLYLNTKEARTRLEHPLEDTLGKICGGDLDPNLFPFYHVGVTLTAGACLPVGEGAFSFETPFIINGCQTINIADHYLKRLEKENAADRIERFRKIPVLAKVVVGATDEQVRDIANCNNRQNPIESWQLFSNDPIHVEIEIALGGVGVFYERQKGKFDADMKYLEALNRYYSTNGTKVTVVELGQTICLCRRQLQLSAKPSDIFAGKQMHDVIFDWEIPNQVRDIIWSFNAFKSVKAALRNYLRMPAHDNEQAQSIFVKPMVKQCLYYGAMMYLYQKRAELAADYAVRLNKKSPPGLINEAEAFYRRSVSKTKSWYLAESKNFDVEVSWRKLEGFLLQLCHEAGLDSEGPMPFTPKHLEWESIMPHDSEGAEA